MLFAINSTDGLWISFDDGLNMLMLAAGDVPVLAPAQPIRGSLRLSLMQRALSAVRDHAAASRSDQRQQSRSVAPAAGLPTSGPCPSSADEATEDCTVLPAEQKSGTHPGSEAQVSRSDPDSDDGVEDSMDALAVLADAVESTPQSPPPKPQPNAQLTVLPTTVAAKKAAIKAEPASGSALDAISALAAIGCAAHAASEVVGPDVEFTVRELEVLAKEVERCVFAVFISA